MGKESDLEIQPPSGCQLEYAVCDYYKLLPTAIAASCCQLQCAIASSCFRQSKEHKQPPGTHLLHPGVRVGRGWRWGRAGGRRGGRPGCRGGRGERGRGPCPLAPPLAHCPCCCLCALSSPPATCLQAPRLPAAPCLDLSPCTAPGAGRCHCTAPAPGRCPCTAPCTGCPACTAVLPAKA